MFVRFGVRDWKKTNEQQALLEEYEVERVVIEDGGKPDPDKWFVRLIYYDARGEGRTDKVIPLRHLINIETEMQGG